MQRYSREPQLDLGRNVWRERRTVRSLPIVGRRRQLLCLAILLEVTPLID